VSRLFIQPPSIASKQGECQEQRGESLVNGLPGANIHPIYYGPQHAQRLNGAQYARVEHGPLQPYIEAAPDLWQVVFGSSASTPAGAEN
jgi:hypothetical protein